MTLKSRPRNEPIHKTDHQLHMEDRRALQDLWDDYMRLTQAVLATIVYKPRLQMWVVEAGLKTLNLASDFQAAYVFLSKEIEAAKRGNLTPFRKSCIHHGVISKVVYRRQ